MQPRARLGFATFVLCSARHQGCYLSSQAQGLAGWEGRRRFRGSRRARHAQAFATTGCRHLASASQPAFVGCTASVMSWLLILLPLMKRAPQSTKLSVLLLDAKALHRGGRGCTPRGCCGYLLQLAGGSGIASAAAAEQLPTTHPAAQARRAWDVALARLCGSCSPPGPPSRLT